MKTPPRKISVFSDFEIGDIVIKRNEQMYVLTKKPDGVDYSTTEADNIKTGGKFGFNKKNKPTPDGFVFDKYGEFVSSDDITHYILKEEYCGLNSRVRKVECD